MGVGKPVAGGVGFDDLPGEGEAADDGAAEPGVKALAQPGRLVAAMATAERSSRSVRT
jgi:hypothetical protein